VTDLAFATGWARAAHALDQGSFLPLTAAIARPKARPQRGERAIATVRGRKTSGLLGMGGALAVDGWLVCSWRIVHRVRNQDLPG